MTVLDCGSELAILAIGMTLVTAASGGQDISVGAGIAIAGSALLRVLCGNNTRPETLNAPIIVAFLVSVLVAMCFGAFNGCLVAFFKIQPMVATLILYTAGRSIAAWINNNELPIVSDATFSYIGGFIPGIPIPTPFFIAAACLLIIALVLKFTNLGLYTQAVGINESSSRLNGLNPTFIKWLSFVILGICVAVAALIKVSRLSSINYSVIAKDIEMDAILAVALGGNALSGGKFNMWASVMGAFVIQLGLREKPQYDPHAELSFLHPGRKANVIYDGTVIGYLGEVHPTVAANYAIKERVYVAVIDMPEIVSRASFDYKYEGITNFPVSSRDLSMVVPKDILFGR